MAQVLLLLTVLALFVIVISLFCRNENTQVTLFLVSIAIFDITVLSFGVWGIVYLITRFLL